MRGRFPLVTSEVAYVRTVRSGESDNLVVEIELCEKETVLRVHVARTCQMRGKTVFLARWGKSVAFFSFGHVCLVFPTAVRLT